MSCINEEELIEYCYNNILSSFNFCKAFLKEVENLINNNGGVSKEHKKAQICITLYLLEEISKYRKIQPIMTTFEIPIKIIDYSSEILWSSDILICFKNSEKNLCYVIEVVRSGSPYNINKKIRVLQKLANKETKSGIFIEEKMYSIYCANNSNGICNINNILSTSLSFFGYYRYNFKNH